MNSRSGSVVQIVVVIIVLAVVAVGVMYFTSDVQRTKIQSAVDQYAHWTPENIAKDPENYLLFCEKEAQQALQSLKASEIAVAQNRGNLESMQKDSETKIRVGEKALTDLKAIYTKADAEKQWPAKWEGREMDQDGVKRQVVNLNRQVAAQKKLVETVSSGIKKLDAQVARIQEGRAQANSQIAEISASRQILKVQKITDDLTKKLVSIKSVLQATINTASEATGPVTLDQLAAETVATVDDKEFQAIMGK